jgi:hypothetical protein
MIFLTEYLNYYLASIPLKLCNKEVTTILGNDTKIRSSIRQQKLAEILEIQQIERETIAKESVKCIFCREFSGTPSLDI